MTSRRSILLGLALSALLGVFGLNSVYAQVPRSISYQGLLVKNGQPVTGTVNLQVSIYDAAGITPLYQESMNAVPVTNGIFNVLLGGNSGTLPQSLKFDELYLLGVNVDGTGEVTPRTPFSAAPYALNAQTVGGVGVSVTPQAGMLLPLDQTGKLPKSVLPLSALAAVNTINGVSGDATNNNISLVSTTPATLTITPNLASNTINFAVTASGGTGIQTVQAGPGLTGGGSTPIVTLGIAPFGITPGMLGIQSVTARNLDQNIPQWGLWQDQIGQLNVGLDQSLRFVGASNTQIPGAPFRVQGGGINSSDGIGINPFFSNTFFVVQNFNGGLTGSLGTLGTLGTNANVLTANGLAEPTASVNGATAYEIIDNGDLLVTGTATIRGNTFIGAGPLNTANTIGNSTSLPTNTMTGTTNTLTASNSTNTTAPTNNNLTATSSGTGVASNNLTAQGGSGANTNTITASGGVGSANSIQAPANNIGTTQASGNTNTIGTAAASVNTVTGTTNTVTGSTSNDIQAPTNRIGTVNASSANIIGNVGTSTNTVTGATNNVTGTTANNVQSPANSIGTTQLVGQTNTIGTASNSVNLIQGQTNTANGSVSNSIQAPTNNMGTTQVAGGANNIGTLAVSTNTINGLINSSQAQTINSGTNQTGGGTITIGNVTNSTTNINGLNNTMTSTNTNNLLGPTNNINATTNNLGTNAGSANNIGSATSTNTVNGTTTFNGIHNINGATTIVGALTQSGGLVNLAGAAGANSFGNASGANNTIGNAANSTNIVQGTTNTLQGGVNNLLGTTNNVNAATNNIGTVTGQTNNIGTGGSSTNTIGVGGSGTNSIQAGTNNIGTVGASSNTIGTAGSSTNVINGSSNTINGPLQVNGTTSTTGNLTLGTASTTNTYAAAGSANRFNGTSNFGTLPASNGNKLIVDGAPNLNPPVGPGGVPTGFSSPGDFEFIVNGDMSVSGWASFNNLTANNVWVNGSLTLAGGATFCANNIQVQTLSPYCSAPASAINVADALTQTTLNGNPNNTFLATNFTGAVNFGANITQSSGTAQFLNTQINGTLGSTGNITLATVSSNNFIGTAGVGATTIQGNTLALNATGANASNGLNATGTTASNVLVASGAGSFNTLTAPNNNLNGILTQTGNATFTGGGTTFNSDNINGSNNSNISNFTTIQANNSMTIGTPGTAATTMTSNTNGAAVSVNLPNVSGSTRVGTMQSWQLNLNPATLGPDGGASVVFNAGTVTPNPLFNYFVNSNSAVSVRYVGHNAGSSSGQLFVFVAGTNVTVESTSPFDNNRVEIIIMTP